MFQFSICLSWRSHHVNEVKAFRWTKLKTKSSTVLEPVAQFPMSKLLALSVRQSKFLPVSIQQIRFLFSDDYKVDVDKPLELDPNWTYDSVKFHNHYSPKVVSSGVVRTEVARYLRDLGIKFGEISNKSPLSGISLFSNYDLQATKDVVDFLSSAGLNNEDICKMILKRPHLLLKSTESLRKRLLELREELDMTKKETVNLICRQPNVLNDAFPLQDVTVKRFHLKRSFMISDEQFMSMVERDPRFLFFSWRKSTDPIIKYLQTFGFYDKQIKKILTTAPSVVGSDNTAKLESQAALFFNYMGFTEPAFQASIPEYPHLLVYRQRLLRLKFDIINGTGRFTWQDIARAPLTLGYSVERIYTRLNFLRDLGLLESTKYHLSSILANSQKYYLRMLAKSDLDSFNAFTEKEKENIKKLRDSIRTKIVHSELELLEEGSNDEK